MFFIPGIVLSIVTFPGVIVHELAHQLFCRWCKVPVFKVCYFQFQNPVGYVLHESARKPLHSVLISIGPFIINTLIALLIALPAALQYKFGAANLLDCVLLYLGVSIAMHAFPSTGDASALWEAVMHGEDTPLIAKILVAPIVGLIYIGAFGSFFWLDALYGIGVAVGLPWLIVKGLA